MNSYITKELKNGKYVLCKILNEYDNKVDANNDLIRVTTKKITEKELLEIYEESKK